MKVLLINDSAAPVGGAEIMTLTLRRGLEARGHDVRLFASNADGGSADYTCRGFTGRRQVLTQAFNVSAFRELRSAIKGFQPDVVHVRMFLTQLSPLILPLLKDIPSVYHAVMYESICPTGLKLLPDGAACRELPGRACLGHGCLSLQAWMPLMAKLRMWERWRGAFNLFVANSEATARRLAESGIGPAEVVHNGVPAWPRRPRLTGPPCIAYAGRLAPEKGVDVLLKAFALVRDQIPRASLVVAGDGPLRSHLETMAHELGIAPNVEFVGHLGREAIERRFAPAWVQAVPSVWDEPFGIVAAEAMMRGTAVVASGSGGLAEIVEEGVTGRLVPPGDVAALAEALTSILVDREHAERLGESARLRALNLFDSDGFVDRIEALYIRLLRDTSHEAVPRFRHSVSNESGRSFS